MIAFTRTALIAPGRFAEAMNFAQTVNAHIKEHYGQTLELLLPVGGNPNRIAWHGRFESLAQWEAMMGKLMRDQTYLALVASNAAQFLPGSVHDEIWRGV